MTAPLAAPPLDIARIARERQVAGNHPPEVWLEGLGALMEQEGRVAPLRPWLRALSIATVGAGILGVLCTILTITKQVGPLALLVFVLLAGGLLVAGGGVLLAIGAARGIGSLRQPAPPARLPELVLPFLAILREEMAPGEPVALRLDLGGAERPAKSRGARDWQDGKTKRREEWFVDPWFSGSARLADDARLSWQLTETLRKRDQSRRNPRGKLKSKTKWQQRQQLAVRLGLPRGRYAVAPAPPPAPRAGASGRKPARAASKVTTRAGAKRDVVALRRVLVANGQRGEPPLEALLELVAQGYGRATQTGHAGRAGGGRS